MIDATLESILYVSILLLVFGMFIYLITRNQVIILQVKEGELKIDTENDK